MNDDPTSDALSRASAYLDGELDAAEIAAADADQEVMAEVALLRSLRAEIRDVPAPSSYARDMAVAAAVAEFDALHPPAVPVRTARRPSYGRWMAVAAAIAGVAALGAVITTAGRGGDDHDSADLASAEESAVAFDANTADRSQAGVAPAPQLESAQSSTMMVTEAPATDVAGGAADQAPAAEASAAAEAAESTAAPATTAAASLTSIAQFDPTTPIADEVDLGRIGRQLLTEWRSGLRDSKTGTVCDGTLPAVVLLSDAVLTVDGATRIVLVAGNPQTDEIVALDPDTCAVIVTGR